MFFEKALTYGLHSLCAVKHIVKIHVVCMQCQVVLRLTLHLILNFSFSVHHKCDL